MTKIEMPEYQNQVTHAHDSSWRSNCCPGLRHVCLFLIGLTHFPGCLQPAAPFTRMSRAYRFFGILP
jgi:hypothetical protein